MDLIIASLGQLDPATSVTAAGWDFMSAVENFTDFVKDAGGLVVGAIGMIMLVIGCIFAGMKLWSSSQKAHERHWGKIAALIVVGGVFTGNGIIDLVKEIGSAQEKTIKDMGGGSAIVDFASHPGLSAVTDFAHSISASGLIGLF